MIYVLSEDIEVTGTAQTIETTVTCQTPGTIGNGLNEGAQLQFIESVDGFVSAIVTETASGGVDAEDEEVYRERIRNHAGSNNQHFIGNEKSQLLNQIEKMRSDLKLWENNLGFLANSKQADLLKEEFERKMDNTRKQIALLEAKLRILNEASEQKEQETETKE
jgi:hypothetical protein